MNKSSWVQTNLVEKYQGANKKVMNLIMKNGL